MSKIALIITFFGEMPFWFPAFQISCQYNKDIEWIIFSDAKKPEKCPSNIIFYYFSIDDFCRLASSKLNMNICLDVNFLYKICDFKPLFGIIYEEYIKNYDFWGHCDTDIIWGEIRKFITNDILLNHDIITSRIGRISGHFCLYKNNNKTNRIVMQIPNIKKILNKISSCERLDEILLTDYLLFLTSKTFFARIKRIFTNKKNIPNIYWKEIMTTSGKNQRKIIEDRNDFFIWNKGKTYYSNGKEIMYIHFHVLKKEQSFKICNVSGCNEYMKITYRGIE